MLHGFNHLGFPKVAVLNLPQPERNNFSEIGMLEEEGFPRSVTDQSKQENFLFVLAVVRIDLVLCLCCIRRIHGIWRQIDVPASTMPALEPSLCEQYKTKMGAETAPKTDEASCTKAVTASLDRETSTSSDDPN